MTQQKPMPQNVNTQTKKSQKRERILAEAISQLNDRGLSFLSLNSVAVSIGLSRNTLYYYFENREDLIYNCYLLAAKATTADLDVIFATDKPAPWRVRQFINLSLSNERVAIGDLTQLNEQQRDAIGELQQENEKKLEYLIDLGIQQGSFRNINPSVASQMLMSFITWHQLSGRWFNTLNSRTSRNNAGEKIADMILNGVSRDPDFRFKYRINYQALQASPFNAFDPKSVNSEKRKQLIGRASQLFNRRGIDAVSLEDIARDLGTSKGAVYHYFKDKPSLIKACYESAFEKYDQIIEAAAGEEFSHLEALLTVNHLNCQAQNTPFPPLILQPGESVFYDDYHAEVHRLKEKIQTMRRLCFKNKSLRELDEDSIELSSGAHFWISKWLSDNPDLKSTWTRIKLANEISGIIAQGISVR